MIYSGQLDVIVSALSTELFLNKLQWSGVDEYLRTQKIIWKTLSMPSEVAGYVRQAKTLTQVYC